MTSLVCTYIFCFSFILLPNLGDPAACEGSRIFFVLPVRVFGLGGKTKKRHRERRWRCVWPADVDGVCFSYQD